MSSVRWYSNDEVAEAVDVARTSGKSLLVDLWHPTCLGCAKLFATTYADPAVQDFLARTVVPIKYNSTKPNEWFRKLNGHTAHFWHPHVLILDDRLIEGSRFIGYLEPSAFMARVRLGVGMLQMYHRRFGDALAAFEAAGSGAVPRNVVAEALYWQGVAAYRVSGFSALEPLWGRLVADHADSDWAQRADCLDVQIPDEGFDPGDPASVQLTRTLAGIGSGPSDA